MSNIVRAIFGGSKTTRTRRLWKIDKGMLLQFVDLNLPTAYQVHFANSPSSGQAKVVTATSDTVEIPYEYLQTGADVYAWVYLTPENGVGYTEYMVTIPVYARPDVTDEEPTPTQQSALDTAISALNSGVDSVQAAVAGVQDSIDAALQEAKDSGEFDGADGYTPVKGVDYFDGEKGDTGATGETGNGIASAVLNADYTLTLTYTDGTTWTSGSIRGERGDKGETGTDGYSPVATVTQTETGATVTITDKTGTTTAEISNGAPGSPGNDGISPTISVTDITGGHRVTITDSTGPHSFDVMDGESGGGAVQDVQVADVSVLSDGVANVPAASSSAPGVVRVNSNYGFEMDGTAIRFKNASDVQLKAGTNQYRTISPSTQHQAAFYGLAKAAGSDEKNSVLPVGEYTDEAKTAIQTMLDVPSKSDIPEVPVQDVQVDGVSVLDAQGVANVPIAGADYGVVKENLAYGIDITGAGQLMLITPSDSDIKNSYGGTRRAIMTLNQHKATFYGLAKAAGSDEKNSTLPIGQYTESAKSAIQTMLGISNIIGTVEGATASTAYSVGGVFLHGGALYKATSAIASGDAIVPGTNCEQTTIIDLLKGA